MNLFDFLLAACNSLKIEINGEPIYRIFKDKTSCIHVDTEKFSFKNFETEEDLLQWFLTQIQQKNIVPRLTENTSASDIAKVMVSLAENLAIEREKCFTLAKVKQGKGDEYWRTLGFKIADVRGEIIDMSEKHGVVWHWSESDVKNKNIGKGALLAEFEGTTLIEA